MITLYPVPFEITETHLRILEKRRWGKREKINFGKLKHYQNIKNGYVNLFIKKAKYLAIQNQVNIMGYWLSVTTPYNRHLPMCRFCKIRGHDIETCPKLQKRQKQNEKEDLKENRIEINNPTEKQKVFSEIPLIDFIVPTRKRSKKQNSQMTTCTPKRKKKRNYTARTLTINKTDSEEEKEINIKHNSKISLNTAKTNTNKKKSSSLISLSPSSSSSEEEF